MNPQEIKLPSFPRYAKQDFEVIKFLSPFHALRIDTDGDEMTYDHNEEMDHLLPVWDKLLKEELQEATVEEFEVARTLAIQKLSEL